LDAQQGDRATVKRAINTSDATSAKTLGVVAQDIPANSDGLVTTLGYLYKCNTSAFTAGQTLYLGATAGTFTATKPYAPNHLVYVGVVVRANAGNGIIYVRCQNGYELNEIHDVQITSPAAGDLIMRNGSNLWINTPQTSITKVGTLTAGTVPASLLSGTTLPASIVSSSLTSVGTLSSGSIPSTLLTGTVASARLSGSYTGITGLGTLSSSLSINLGALGTTSGNTLTHFSRIATTTNTDTLDTRLIRGANGSDWSSAYWRIGRLVDATRMGFIQFGDTGSSQDVKFGIGTTVYGTVNTSGFAGAGSQLTSLNASNLSSGTVASARISGSYTGFTSITVDGPSSAAFTLGDWSTNANYGGVVGNKGYLLIGNNSADSGIYLRTSTASGPVYIGTSSTDTLTVTTQVLYRGNISLAANNTYQCAALPAFGFNAWAGVSSYNFYNASDIRYKSNVEELPLGLDFIKLLNPIEFTYVYPEFGEDSNTPTSTTEGSRLRAGLSAQNVKEALETVNAGDYNFWALADKNNPESFQALDYIGLVAPIIKAIQELDARLQQLETV
jgi:hypothetical protein